MELSPNRSQTLDRSVFPTPQPTLPPNFDASACKRLITNDFPRTELIPLISGIFTSKDEIRMIGDLTGDDAQTFIDVMHEALDHTDLPSTLWKKCLSAMCKICGRHALLPKSLRISLSYDRSDIPLYQGGFADVWMSEYQGSQVAVKVLRVCSTSNFPDITKRFCKEVVTWKFLRHSNVLPLLGIVMDGTHFAMVSEWMENGNINEFIRAHRDANRFELLKDTAKGLIYMHSQAMIHGDLKGGNILIDQGGRACLADFGLLTIASDPANTTASSVLAEGGTTRWMSPELLDPGQFGIKDSRPTKESDSYALGMVILEVLSGHSPFKGFNSPTVTRMVTEGKQPERPDGPEGAWFTDDLWQMLTSCWEYQRESRPSVDAILELLEQLSGAWKPLASQIDEDAEMDEDVWDLTAVNKSSVRPTPQPSPGAAEDILRERHQTSQASHHALGNANTSVSKATPIKQSRSKLVSKAPEKFTPRGIKGSSFHAAVDALASRARSTDITVTEAEAIVEELDELMPRVWDKREKDDCLRVLREVCREHAILPKSYIISDVEQMERRQLGGVADLWTGKLGQRDVCIKVFRYYQFENLQRIKGAVCDCAVRWKNLSHPNLIPFPRVSKIFPPFGLVTPWMLGNIIEYTREHQDADRLLLLKNAACGLEYLHSLDVVHGRINPRNILITGAVTACIGDFWVADITNILGSGQGTTAAQQQVNIRYMAPEQLCNRPAGKETDVYSFAITAYEVLVGFDAYSGIGWNGPLCLRIMSGTRPIRPKDAAAARWLSGDIWRMLGSCWATDPSARPAIGECTERFRLPLLKELLNRIPGRFRR